MEAMSCSVYLSSPSSSSSSSSSSILHALGYRNSSLNSNRHGDYHQQLLIKTRRNPYSCRGGHVVVCGSIGNYQQLLAEVAPSSSALYGLLLSSGGLYAFTKSGSKGSLFGGLTGGALMAAVYILMQSAESRPIGDALGFGSAFLFTSVFGSKCFFCDSGTENYFHLFAECPFASALWFSSPFPVRLNLVTVESIPELLCKLCEGVKGDVRGQMLGCFAILFETIWNIRNRIVHQGEAVWSIDQARRAISNRFQELVSSYTAHSSINPSSVHDVPLKLSSKYLVVVDGSFSHGHFGCAAVFMSRDSTNWNFNTATGLCDSALAAEMEAVSRGVQWAKNYGWVDFTIASDSKILVEAIATKNCPNWQLTSAFYLLLQLLDSCSKCSVVFIGRKTISFVDELAKSARHSKSGSLNCQGEGLPPVNPSLFWYSVGCYSKIDSCRPSFRCLHMCIAHLYLSLSTRYASFSYLVPTFICMSLLLLMLVI